MRETIQRVLELQRDYTAANTPAMQERGQLIRHDGPEALRELVPRLGPLFPSGARDLFAEGRDGTGQRTEIPWYRLASRALSPNARTGWYLVYLFDGLGDAAYLSLNQGTTTFDGSQFTPLARSLLAERVRWAMDQLDAAGVDRNPPDSIDLQATRSLGGAYERGNVTAIRYEVDSIPSDDVLAADLMEFSHTLAVLYAAQLSGQAPGDVPAEIQAAEDATSAAAGRPPRGRAGFRPNAAQRKAIEQRGMELATRHLKADGWSVRDVSALRSYDLKAGRAGESLDVEVKATSSDGRQVLVTTNEVVHALAHHPATALIIVHGIALDGDDAVGGTVVMYRPWLPEADSLTPIAYRYVVSEVQ